MVRAYWEQVVQTQFTQRSLGEDMEGVSELVNNPNIHEVLQDADLNSADAHAKADKAGFVPVAAII
jgi:hypothetical protein